MTLLSIREQEAVKEAANELHWWGKNLHPELTPWPDPRLTPREAFCADLDAYTQAVILATRDAIARQVRERDLGAKIVNDDTATFIEGLDV